MPRRLRFAPPGYWLHLTQRGNNQQSVFSTDADQQHFLDLVEQHSEERDARVAAYTLMSNHFPLGRGWRLPGCDLKLHDGGKLRSVSASLLPRSLFEVRVES